MKKNSVADPDPDTDPVGFCLFCVTRIRILKTGSADPDPKTMNRIRNTGKNSPKNTGPQQVSVFF